MKFCQSHLRDYIAFSGSLNGFKKSMQQPSSLNRVQPKPIAAGISPRRIGRTSLASPLWCMSSIHLGNVAQELLFELVRGLGLKAGTRSAWPSSFRRAKLAACCPVSHIHLQDPPSTLLFPRTLLTPPPHLQCDFPTCSKSGG